MILEYHKIDYPEERWTRTPENFRRDLETLYAARLPAAEPDTGWSRDASRCPAGTTPVVLTFDDSSPGQFRYIENATARWRSIPSARWESSRPSARRSRTSAGPRPSSCCPGAKPPNSLFNQPEHGRAKLRWLVEHGYEIGNHTLWHANLGKYDETVVRTQLADAQDWVQRHVRGTGCAPWRSPRRLSQGGRLGNRGSVKGTGTATRRS